MRVLFWILPVVILLILGFWPQPFVGPNWKAPMKTAIAANDCDDIERLVQILEITGHEAEWASTVADLATAKLCRYSEIDPDRIGSLRIFSQSLADYPGYSQGTLRRSLLGSRISFFLAALPYSNDPIVRSAELQLQSILRRCHQSISTLGGGSPNRDLLDYAIKNPDLRSEDIRRIAFQQLGLCSHEWMMTVGLMAESARTEKELEKAARSMEWSRTWSNFAPPLFESYRYISTTLLERGLSPDASYLFEPELRDSEMCEPRRAASRELWASIQCADYDFSSTYASQSPELMKLYFALRSRRLGWQDIASVESTSIARLSPECVIAMREIEASEAGQAQNPRDFGQFDWPNGPGEACEDGGLKPSAAAQVD